MKTGKMLRKLRLSPLSLRYYDRSSSSELKDVDCESLAEATETDFTVSSTASFCDFGNLCDDETEWDEEAEEVPGRRVRFCSKKDSREVPSCFLMEPSEREAQWYMRHELALMKTEARALAKGLNAHKTEMVSSLRKSYNHAKFMCEAGIDEQELLKAGNGTILENLQPWSMDVLAGEACRGLEKSLLRREREMNIKECRELVMETAMLYQEDPACADMIAVGYCQLSCYATIYAHSVAQADEVAARCSL